MQTAKIDRVYRNGYPKGMTISKITVKCRKQIAQIKMEHFKKLGLSEKFIKTIEEHKFSKPSEIQEKTIPLVLQGKDVIGTSATGSGKTLAFGAGIIEKSVYGEGVQALIMTPTRELAEQVAESLRRFSRNHRLNILEIYGGVGINPQIRGLEDADIVVGTPGRLLDHLERRTLDLSKVKVLVLDEADRMVDMGFLPDVEKIIKLCPQDRQTLLFSATMTPDVKYIEKRYMKNPELVSVEQYVDPSKLKQYFYDVEPFRKFSLLVHLLKNDPTNLVMVFTNTRRNADVIAQNLNRAGLKAMAIHGGLTQNRRSNVLDTFQSENVKILVCTDVAARGLDIKNVSHVYNYDIPKISNDYIHRVGRTARAGKEGEAISLVCNKDYANFREVCSDDSLKIEPKELPQFEDVHLNFNDDSDRRGGRGFGGRRFGGNRDGGRFGGDRAKGRRFGGHGGGAGNRGGGFGGRGRVGGYRGGRSGSGREFGRGRFSDSGRSSRDDRVRL